VPLKDSLEIRNRLNFRSLDGIRFSDGTKLTSSRLFRSAAPDVEDLPAFTGFVQTHGIRTLVDLRTTGERAESENRLDSSVAVNWISIPLFENIAPHWENPSDLSPKATAARKMEMLESGIPAIARILDLVSNPNNTPILFHCAKGRDRTGIVVASILMLLGADLDSVSDDYRIYQSRGPSDPMPQKDTIIELFKLIQIRHGSILNMLSEHSDGSFDIQKVIRVFRGDL
jgi:protein-tyrosine phosphatase